MFFLSFEIIVRNN